MSNINPYLIARCHAIQAAFDASQRNRNVIAVAPTRNANPATGNKVSFKDILDKEDENGGESGGRGTMKGLRGKDAQNAKNAMRKLSRR